MAEKPEKRWRILSRPSDASRRLAVQAGIQPLTAQLLQSRNVCHPDAIRSFLAPSLGGLHDPSLMPGMMDAAVRIRKAVEDGERICVYGDYDVDGLTATAILVRCLRMLGADVVYHIPHRLTEGYGIHADTVSALAEAGADLLVTVDCGVSAVAEVALARKLGMEVIVTDHHEPGDEVPADVLIVNPKLPGSSYPFRELAGAGIAFKLAWAIGKSFSKGKRVSERFKSFLLDSMTLAGLGTIADVVPLRDENRVIAHFGLKGLGGSDAPGIRALCEAAGLDSTFPSAFDVAFKLAPRLNALGRMGCARRGVELLTTESDDEAREIAASLNVENRRRQDVQQGILAEARDMIAAADGVDGRQSIVLAREGWHAGVLGIVAARLSDEYWRPTILLTSDGGEAHGSGRSVEAVNLFDALHDCADRLLGYGGHAMAAGLRLKADEIDPFRDAFEAAVAARLAGVPPAPTMDVAAEVRLPDLTRTLMGEIESLAPFGSGNEEPVLAAFGVTLTGAASRMGSGGKHLTFRVRQDGAPMRAVGFNMGGLADRIAEGGPCSLAFTPRVNRWRGRSDIEIEVRDIKFTTDRRHVLEGE